MSIPEPTPKEIAEYLAHSETDFGFELSVLGHCERQGLKCIHGGTYVDPVTGKGRQFDIRAHNNLEEFHISLAIECKNLSPSFR
jgi:hypothetical protein